MNNTTTSVENIINSTLQNTTQIVQEVTPTFIGLPTPFTTSPFLDILIISIIASLFTTMLNKYLTDQVAIKALRAEMKKKQKVMREKLKTNPQEAQKMQVEIMQKNMELMKHSMNFKVIAITLLPMLYVFTQIRSGYMHYDVITNLGVLSFGWLGTYLILAIISSIALKKILKVA